MTAFEDDFSGAFGFGDDSDEEYNSKKFYKTFAGVAKMIGSFHGWSDLAPELKMEVVSHLDYHTRTNLSFCSKKDYDVVNASPIEISEIEMKDNEADNFYISSQPIKSVSVRIKFGDEYDDSEDQKIHLNFIKRENDTEVRWLTRPATRRPISKFLILASRDYYEESVKFVEKWLKKSRYSVKVLTIEMQRWFFETSNIQQLPQCVDIKLLNKDERFLEWWLAKVRPNLKSLKVFHCGPRNLSTEFLKMDHFKLSDFVHVTGFSNFTDEQFLSMTASHIAVHSCTITDQALNQFIKNWINGNVRKDFWGISIWMNREWVKEEILKDINFRTWDDDFKDEEIGFCSDWELVSGGRPSFQIPKGVGSDTSATLSISGCWFTFAVTGIKMMYKGQKYIYYSIPLGLERG